MHLDDGATTQSWTGNQTSTFQFVEAPNMYFYLEINEILLLEVEVIVN